jgi:hypothetical protein
MIKPCQSCDILNLDCASCQRCLPKYLCCQVNITPSSTGTGSDIDCCGYDMLMKFSCPVGEAFGGGWAGNATCLITGRLPFSIIAVLTKDDSGCHTQVGIFLNDILQPLLKFDGVLPDDMTFDLTDNRGNRYQGTISRYGHMVANPQACDICSPCICVTCIPGILSVNVQGNAPNYFLPNGDPEPVLCHCSNTELFLFDSVLREWIGPPIPCANVTVYTTIKLAQAPDQFCGFHITFHTSPTGTGTELYSFIISFEGSTSDRWLRGVPCEGEFGLTNVGLPSLKPCPPSTGTVGEDGQDGNCPDPPPTLFNTQVQASFFLHQGTPEACNVTVAAFACGMRNIGETPQVAVCKCSDNIPTTLNLTVSSDCPGINGYNIQLVWDGCGSWRAKVVTPDQGIGGGSSRTVYFNLKFSEGVVSFEYHDVTGIDPVFFDPPTMFSCSPFILVFNGISTMRIFADPVCNPITTTFITVTITA